MEIQRKEIRVKEGDEVHLYVLGDTHEGNANHQRRSLIQAVKEIEEDESPKLVVLTGDLIECILPGDKRFNASTIDRRYDLRDLKNLPYKQADNVCTVMEPIKNYVCGYLIGNHEETYISRHFADVYDYIGRFFPKAQKMGGMGVVRVVLEQIVPKGDGHHDSFDFWFRHGTSGGGKMMGYAENKLRESFEWEDVDFGIMGHHHVLRAVRGKIRQLNNFSTDIIEKKIWYGVAGCFKKTYVTGNGDWYEPKGRQEADIGYLKAVMSSHREQIGRKRTWKRHTDLQKVYLD